MEEGVPITDLGVTQTGIPFFDASPEERRKMILNDDLDALVQVCRRLGRDVREAITEPKLPKGCSGKYPIDAFEDVMYWQRSDTLSVWPEWHEFEVEDLRPFWEELKERGMGPRNAARFLHEVVCKVLYEPDTDE